MRSSETGLVESGNAASSAGVDDYESVWNGPDELIHRPPRPHAPSKICRLCWNPRPLGEFDKRRICRRCVRILNKARLRGYREAAKTTGMCQVCLKRRAAAGLTMCGECRVRQRAQNVTYRQRLRDEGRCVWIVLRVSRRDGSGPGAGRVSTMREEGQPTCDTHASLRGCVAPAAGDREPCSSGVRRPRDGGAV